MRVISFYFAFRRGPLEMVLGSTRECPMRRILETDSKSFPYNISLKLVLRGTRECLIRRVPEIDSKCFP